MKRWSDPPLLISQHVQPCKVMQTLCISQLNLGIGLFIDPLGIGWYTLDFSQFTEYKDV